MAEFLRQDTSRQLCGKDEQHELPSLLEIKSMLIDQVDKLPASMMGRIKVILNRILYNINHVDQTNLDEQLDFFLARVHQI